MTEKHAYPNQADDDLWYPSALPPDVEAFVGQWGQSFSPPTAPLKGPWVSRRRRVHGRCYDSAGQWYRENGISYVEGVASSVWDVPHAWLVTSEGEVIELARKEPATAYRGVVIPDDLVGRAHVVTMVYGPVLPVIMRKFGWVPSDEPT